MSTSTCFRTRRAAGLRLVVRDALSALLPLALFMLIPIWIPLVAITIGTVLDWLRFSSLSPASRSTSKKGNEASTDRSNR